MSDDFRVNGKTTLPALAALTEKTGRNLNFSQILDVIFTRCRKGESYGYFTGTPRTLAGLIGWHSETVRALYEKLLSLPNGGNKALAALPVEDSRLVRFYSEAVANSLIAQDDKERRREEWRAKNRNRAKAEKPAPSNEPAAPELLNEAPGIDESADFCQTWNDFAENRKARSRRECWRLWQGNGLDAFPWLVGRVRRLDGNESLFIDEVLKIAIAAAPATRECYESDFGESYPVLCNG